MDIILEYFNFYPEHGEREQINTCGLKIYCIHVEQKLQFK